MRSHCDACTRYGDVDRCHIQSRGAGGEELPFNLLLMCREHHAMQHQLGWAAMIERFPRLEKVLRKKGWGLREIMGVVKMVRLERHDG